MLSGIAGLLGSLATINVVMLQEDIYVGKSFMFAQLEPGAESSVSAISKHLHYNAFNVEKATAILKIDLMQE